MFKRMMVIAVLTFLLGAVFGVENTARAGGTDDADLKKIIELIAQQRDADHVKLTSNDKVSIPNDLKDGISYRLEHTKTDSKTGKSITVVDGVARFYPPVTDTHKFKSVHDDGGLAVYNGGSYHLAVDVAQYGFSTYIAILDAGAPTDYEFDYELPSGFKLSEEGDIGIAIRNADEGIIGLILPPWAYDANGDAIPTELKLRNDTLVQTIAHTDAVYPVVADPSTHLGYRVARLGMTQGERDWCDSDNNEEICVPAYGVHGVTTIAVTVRLYGAYGGDDYKDAFQHCYWSARMTIGLGYTDAKTIGDLHESADPDNTRDRERMDKWNNKQGRNLGSTLRRTTWPYPDQR